MVSGGPRRFLLGAVTFAIFASNTVLWCTALYVVAAIRFLVPVAAFRKACNRLIIWIAERWTDGNTLGLDLTQPTVWDVRGGEGLRRDAWYLVVANHRSWVDITVLQRVFNSRFPFLKFFLKKELIWVPVLGLAWWILGFPFMKRYPRKLLEQSPELRREDFETTRKACDGFREAPVSVVTFVEGTRFTEEKHREKDSPYRHLLLPKAGGLAYVSTALADRLTSLVDVTIAYPDGPCDFWDLISGGLSRVVVRIEERPIPQHWRIGDYLEDAAFRERFQADLRDLWEQKDELLETFYGSGSGSEVSVMPSNRNVER